MGLNIVEFKASNKELEQQENASKKKGVGDFVYDVQNVSARSSKL